MYFGILLVKLEVYMLNWLDSLNPVAFGLLVFAVAWTCSFLKDIWRTRKDF